MQQWATLGDSEYGPTVEAHEVEASSARCAQCYREREWLKGSARLHGATG
jgi:hypothetical protein